MNIEEQIIIGAIAYIDNRTLRYASIEEIHKHVYLSMEEVKTQLERLVDDKIIKLEDGFYTIIGAYKKGN